ncbi:MAG: Dabb family protein [Microbacter sp.]
MIKHLVFWRLKEEAFGNNKATNALLIKKKLEDLNGQIEGLIHLEVGIDFSKKEDSYDVALYAEFESRNALAYYQEHPKHKEIQQFVKAVRTDRCAVDYDSSLKMNTPNN